MEKHELDSILEEQREYLMAAKTLISDQNLALNLQMQEALTASLLAADNEQTPLLDPSNHKQDDAVFDYTSLILEDLNRLDQERKDREFTEKGMQKIREDLNCRMHDQKFASEIKNIPENEWLRAGDNYEKPYHLEGGDGVEDESFRLYFKGMVSEERIGEMRVVVGGVGVAVCDQRDNLIWEVKKRVEGGERKSGDVVEVEALVSGLEEALSLGLKRVTFLCDDFMVYQYVTGGVEPRQSTLATLVNQVAQLQRQFSYCLPSLVARKDIKFVFKFARDAIVSQIKWPAESSKGKTFKETCMICFEAIDVEKMFSVEGCYHRFCFSCMKQHVEVKVLNGTVAKCPSEDCESEVAVDSCAKFLDPKLVEIMSQRLKEAAIAVSDKVYCPYPKCSALMSKHEVLEYTKSVYVGVEQSGARKCMKCGCFFCINCKVRWHGNMTCYDYNRSNLNRNAEDAKLKSLAEKKQWRQCAKCSHMVELVWGCYHITCRCGYEFCYTCGAAWKNKKATCSCPIWDERNIIRDRNRRR